MSPKENLSWKNVVKCWVRLLLSMAAILVISCTLAVASLCPVVTVLLLPW